MNRAGFNDLLNKAKRSAKFAVSHGQSPVLSLVINNSSEASLITTSQFLTAFAAVQDGEYQGWISARGLTAMADLVFHQHNDFRRLPSPNQDALYYGAMTAMWIVVTPETPIDENRILNARQQLCSKIRRMQPPIALIRSAFSNWVSTWRRNDVLSRHNLLLHWFPLQLSTGGTEEFRRNILQCCNGTDDEPSLDLSDVEIAALREIRDGDELTNLWRTLTNNELVSFFVVLSFNNSKYEMDIVKAMFCMVATTTKTSFSDQWLQSRWSNIQQDNPLLAESDAIDREVLTLYENFFQRTITSIPKKVNILYYSYFLAHQQRLEGVKRIIEQSKAPHVSGLNALCNLTLQFPTVTYTMLNRIFGARQVNSVVKLAAHLINNPYVTLITTPVPVSMYADIAYVATEILYASGANRRNRQARYVSPAEKSLTKTAEYLKAFAANLIADQERRATQDMASHSILSAYGLTLNETRENTLIITGIDARAPVNAIEGQQTENRRFEIPVADFEGFILSLRNAQDLSFIEIMSELNRVSAQAVLPMPTGDDAAASASAMKTEALNEGLIRHLTTLGVPIDQAWNQSLGLLEVDTMYNIINIM